jgi:ribosomal protein S19
MTPEGKVKDTIKKWLKSLRAWWFLPLMTGGGQSGVPDAIACIPVTVTPEMVGRTIGVFVAIEAKAPGRRGEKNRGCSGLQVMQMKKIREAGGLAFVVDGEEDLGEVERSLTHSRQ